MIEELKELFQGMIDYFIKSVTYVKPIWIVITSGVSYLFFPNEAYITSALGLMIAVSLDIISKYYAISVKNGGFRKAIKAGKLSSETLWKGTKKKLISIFTVMLICGLAIRFTPLLPEVASGITAVAYTIMLYRELQSILENLIDAGYDDLKWFLIQIKRKQKDVLESDDINNVAVNSNENNDINNTNEIEVKNENSNIPTI